MGRFFYRVEARAVSFFYFPSKKVEILKLDEQWGKILWQFVYLFQAIRYFCVLANGKPRVVTGVEFRCHADMLCPCNLGCRIGRWVVYEWYSLFDRENKEWLCMMWCKTDGLIWCALCVEINFLISLACCLFYPGWL